MPLLRRGGRRGRRKRKEKRRGRARKSKNKRFFSIFGRFFFPLRRPSQVLLHTRFSCSPLTPFPSRTRYVSLSLCSDVLLLLLLLLSLPLSLFQAAAMLMLRESEGERLSRSLPTISMVFRCRLSLFSLSFNTHTHQLHPRFSHSIFTSGLISRACIRGEGSENTERKSVRLDESFFSLPSIVRKKHRFAAD